jgi:hypothetical protein
VSTGLTATVSTNGAFLDRPFVPTLGADASSTLTLAGPPGSEGHLKSTSAVSLHAPLSLLAPAPLLPPPLRSLLSSLSLHANASLGLLQPLSFAGLCSGAAHPADRFPPNAGLKGFTNIGPRAAKGDYLGGTLSAAGCLSLSAPFPGKDVSARALAFVSAGSLSDLADLSASSLPVQRVSAGVGIAVPTPVGRAEITFSRPLRKGEGDATQWMQLGLSLNVGG